MKKTRIAVFVAIGLTIGMAAQAVVVDFTSAEGYTDQATLASHPDWNAQSNWTNQNSVGDGVVESLDGDFIRGNYQALSWDNTVGSTLTQGARFTLNGSINTNVTVDEPWKEGIYTLDVTEQLAASAPGGRMEAGLNLDRFTKELQLRAGGQTTVIGDATLFDGHTWVLTVSWTKSDATSYMVAASIDSLDDGAGPFLASGTSTPDGTLSGASEAHGFFKALPSSEQNYGGVQVDQFSIETFSPPPLILNITEFALSGADAILTWDSESGAVYTVEGNLDLLDTNAWADVPGFVDMTGTVNGTMSITGLLDGPVYAYRVDGIPPPPIFFDDLEGGAPGWSNFTLMGSTVWELGTPAYTNTRGIFATAYSGTNAWATALTNAYAMDDNILLRTPEINLSGASGAVLTFYQVTDLEPDFDFGYVNILTNGVVAETNLYAANGTSANWTQQTVNLNPYTNQQIVIEFELDSDGVDFEKDWFGWAIDDISVTKGAPTPPPPPPFATSVTNLVLVDSSGTNNPPPDLAVITEGAILDLDALGVANTNVNIRAEIDGPAGSVYFDLTGATVNGHNENTPPYYQFLDDGGNPRDGTLNAGAHMLVVTPWELVNGGGQAGTNLTVNFTVTFTP